MNFVESIIAVQVVLVPVHGLVPLGYPPVAPAQPKNVELAAGVDIIVT